MAPVATSPTPVPQSAAPSQLSHADQLGAKGFAAAQASGKAPPPAGAKVPSLAGVLTSGQYDMDTSVLTPYDQLPKKITGPTVWTKEELGDKANEDRWVRWWTQEEIGQFEKAAKDWVASGRPHVEIERATVDLPTSLQATLLGLRHKILHRQGFYLFKGFPVT